MSIRGINKKPMKIEAIIFDFNGVLVDDERIHFRGFQRSLQTLNMDLNWEQYQKKYLPYDDKNFYLNFFLDHGHSTDLGLIRRLINLKSRYYFSAIEKKIPVFQSSVDFIHRLTPNLPLGIASAAAREEIDFILRIISLEHRFDTIVAAGDVKNGKPHPEAFLKTLEKLKKLRPGIKPEKVVVIEDSDRGIQSAHAAKMSCIGLTTSYPAKRLDAANLVLENLQGWTLEKLECALENSPSI